MTTTYQVIIIAILVLVILQLGTIFFLARYMGNFLNKIRGFKGLEFGTLEIGEKAPAFRKFDHKERKVVLSHLVMEKKTLLLFISSDCPTCKTLLPEIKPLLASYNVHMILINKDNVGHDAHITELIPDSAHYLRSPQIFESYEINRVPYAMLIDRQGKIEQHSSVSEAHVLWNMLLQEERLAS